MSSEMSQLTTELETLEQSITLTLQEIDHNFSKCHQIITSCILPLVEKYSDSSKEIWSSSKFWKQFFEESAHVSFSSYEEPATATTEGSIKMGEERDEETFLGSSGLVDESTPGNEGNKKTQWADIVSPFEQLQREMSRYQGSCTPMTVTLDEMQTPRRDFEKGGLEKGGLDGLEKGLDGLEKGLDGQFIETLKGHEPLRKRQFIDEPLRKEVFIETLKGQFIDSTPVRKQDILLHRVLDSNWRLKATPFEQSISSTCSSPIEPRLNSVVFTPKRVEESDSEDEGTMSPPVTMQFSVAQSRLLRTPARDVACRLVDDILKTAGGCSSGFEETGESTMMNLNLNSFSDSDSVRFSVDGTGSPIRK
ncbi:DASH complex subunit ask1 [Neolecta irregularis DAH-3]|uniref:DASH complex subunit ASK1 n=1 Tax=Neolecta irregularis (strain DAH-3) TaxID=1198029 RepID=A0A1U7LIQ3_NEOID|nr:DASH complex subunit ask1 [Neolecta irregularis DAH-3]|eukprot:OLL22546.1 DASH complex subunit ask1 [Neolecta irregularis DAH-3]